MKKSLFTAVSEEQSSTVSGGDLITITTPGGATLTIDTNDLKNWKFSLPANLDLSKYNPSNSNSDSDYPTILN